MLDQAQLNIAVEMQARSYLLLRWLSDAIKKQFIRFDQAHDYSTFPEAAEAWIREHYLNIPEDARIAKQVLPEFTKFFSTYLENSFDLVEDPGKHRRLSSKVCFCPMCSWLVDAPHLRPKKPLQEHKRHAKKLRASAIRQLAIEKRVDISDKRVHTMITDPDLIEPTALVAYGQDLLKRMKGIATGPAVLVLWRNFAWTPMGSPKKKFRLGAEMILDAERQLCEQVSTVFE